MIRAKLAQTIDDLATQKAYYLVKQAVFQGVTEEDIMTGFDHHYKEIERQVEEEMAKKRLLGLKHEGLVGGLGIVVLLRLLNVLRQRKSALKVPTSTTSGLTTNTLKNTLRK